MSRPSARNSDLYKEARFNQDNSVNESSFVSNEPVQQTSDTLNLIRNSLGAAWPANATMSYAAARDCFRKLDEEPIQIKPETGRVVIVNGVPVNIGLLVDLIIYHHCCELNKQNKELPLYLSAFLKGTPREKE